MCERKKEPHAHLSKGRSKKNIFSINMAAKKKAKKPAKKVAKKKVAKKGKRK